MGFGRGRGPPFLTLPLTSSWGGGNKSSQWERDERVDPVCRLDEVAGLRRSAVAKCRTQERGHSRKCGGDQPWSYGHHRSRRAEIRNLHSGLTARKNHPQEQTIGTRHLDVFLGTRPKSRVVVGDVLRRLSEFAVDVARGAGTRGSNRALDAGSCPGGRRSRNQDRPARMLKRSARPRRCRICPRCTCGASGITGPEEFWLGMRSTLVRSRTQQINCVRGFCQGQRIAARRGRPSDIRQTVREAGTSDGIRRGGAREHRASPAGRLRSATS